ncbi:MAG: GNAT family N-acetyltransferase [Spirochaetes bacterium]|jgi:predicted acetyltransferase|nr:GNAT family N-acetyltransferase [Spirochaetota bacterium]
MERRRDQQQLDIRMRRYSDPADRSAAIRIWNEVGWIEDEKREQEGLAVFLSGADAWLAELRNSPECMVATMPGTVMYLSQEIRMRAVMAVSTSRVGRRQGLARRLTAHALANDAREGELVSLLGMFDQGFYDHLGYGTGAYERFISFDPAALRVEGRPSVPHRLTMKDAALIHESRLHRMRIHGSCTILPEAASSAEMILCKGGFGLGYFSEDGRLTHHLWAVPKGENGPYRVEWLAYETPEQFLELLRLIKGLGDQVYCVQMKEPRWVHMQDLLDQPFRNRTRTKRSELETSWESSAYWQVRILDLEKVMAVTSVPDRGQISFNLQLEDPIARYLQDSDGWSGTAGTYVVTVGEVSHARPGRENALPTMHSTVNAFSRLWFGAASPLSLALTGELDASSELLEELGWILCLPIPSLDWVF